MRRFKGILSVIVACFLITGILSTAAFAKQEGINVVETIKNMQGVVNYNAVAQTALIEAGKASILIKAGTTDALINGISVTLDNAPYIEDGNIYVSQGTLDRIKNEVLLSLNDSGFEWVKSYQMPSGQAEIACSTPDGRKLIVTESNNASISILNIYDMNKISTQKQVNFKYMAENVNVTSIAVTPNGKYALAAIRTGDNLNNANKGYVAVVDIRTGSVVKTYTVGIGPDGIAISGDGRMAVICNEDEEGDPSDDGEINFAKVKRPGTISIIEFEDGDVFQGKHYELSIDLSRAYNHVTYPNDPQPEYVAISPDNKLAAVTLQENNAIAIINLESKKIDRIFGLGITKHLADTKDDDKVSFSDNLRARFEPDGIVWSLDGKYLVTANEGDLGKNEFEDGIMAGGRNIAIWDLYGNIVYDSMDLIDKAAAQAGLYPDDRSGKKGSEVENLTIGEINGTPVLAVASERASCILFFDVTDIKKPEYMGLIPSGGVAPEGIHKIGNKNMFVSANEEDGTLGFYEKKYVEVRILGNNDFHGQINTTGKVSGKPVGRADYLAAYLKQRDGRNTLIVHAGDMIGASAPASSLLQDEPTIRIMNKIGFDVGAAGNHEFDEGIDELKRIAFGGSHDATGYFEGMDFPFVAANVVYKDTNKPVFQPWVVKMVDNIPVGFTGSVLTETPTIVIPDGVASISFIDEVEAINKAVAEMKALGIKTIVVLAHNPSSWDWDTATTTGDIADIANAIDDEVDLIFAGHNHYYNNGEVDGKLIVQSYSNGTAFSDVKLLIDPVTKDVVSKSAEIITTWQEGITPDAEITAMINAYEDEIKPVTSKAVGTAAIDLTRAENESGESLLGNLIADAQRAEMGTDFAFMNPGGIRADLEKGDVTWGELYTIQPFNNDLVKMTLTGTQIRTLLNQQWQESATRILKISGLKYTWDSTRAKGDRVVDIMLPNGALIDLAKKYTVTVNSFLAGGGDNFTILKEGTDRETGPVDLDALVRYIQGQSKPITAQIEGRITKIK